MTTTAGLHGVTVHYYGIVDQDGMLLVDQDGMLLTFASSARSRSPAPRLYTTKAKAEARRKNLYRPETYKVIPVTVEYYLED